MKKKASQNLPTPSLASQPGSSSASHTAPAGAAVGHLAAAMAHEVRNRLNPINIRVELLRARGAESKPADLAKALEVIQGEVDRIDAILAEFLRHVGPVEASLGSVKVAQAIGEAVARTAEAAKRHGVRVEVEVAAGVGAWPMDRVAIALSLDALIENAIEATPGGGVVTIAAKAEDENGSIEIVDRGEGIPRESLQKVFLLGYSTRSGHAGTGLAVAKQAVRAHPGGSLMLRSEGAGKGTVARIEVPLDDPGGDLDQAEDA